MKITLRAARVNAGLSAKEAAEKAGVNYSTIINWETGKTVPRANIFAKLCEIYRADGADIVLQHKDELFRRAELDELFAEKEERA